MRTLYARLHDKYGPSRRDFMRTTVAATAGLLLSSTSLGQTTKTAAANKHVLIVGGGFSGLACAYELKAAGYKVTVFEARKRVGGRVVSAKVNSKQTIELGGELIGSNHPLWMAYKDKFQLTLNDVKEDENNVPIVFQGKKLSEAEGKQLYEDMDSLIKAMTADAANVNPDAPWEHPKAKEWDALSTAAWIEKQDAPKLAKLAFATQLSTNNTVPIIMQSYLGNLTQVAGGGGEKYWTDSETNRCNGGNQMLAKKLAEAIGDSLVSVAVTSINVGDTKVKVKTADGRTFEGDEVVLTAPPSVWDRIAIEPAIPVDYKPQMGVATKYITLCKSRFWEGKHSVWAFSDGLVNMTWEATESQPGEGVVLTAFSGATSAKLVHEAGDERDSKMRDELEILFPGYADAVDSTRFMDWVEEEWTKASYCFPSPGQVTAIGPKLREGMGRLHFAGEHTCFAFIGYMEGALSSGVRIAKKIAAKDGVKV